MTFTPPSEFADLSIALAQTAVSPDCSQDQLAPRSQWRRRFFRPETRRCYRSDLAGLALSEPPRDTRHRLAHFLGRTRIGKANELMAMNRIEVDAGRRRDMRLFQHLFGKLITVGGE